MKTLKVKSLKISITLTDKPTSCPAHVGGLGEEPKQNKRHIGSGASNAHAQDS